MSLTQELTALFEDAFETQGLPRELGDVRISDRPEMAQFQCNGAMPAAKHAKKNPREIAQLIVDHVNDNPIFKSLELAGPGFINIHVQDDVLAKNVQGVRTPVLSNEDPVVLDYGGPNIAKPMHVGHLRTAIIGDTLRRILKAGGFKTYGDVHMGDWGTHLGILMMDYIRNNEQDLVLQTSLDDPEDVLRLFNDMAERYPKASAAAKEDDTLKAEALEATVKLQNKEDPFYSMWQKIREISISAMKRNYGLLNVEFDLWKGEADVHELIDPMGDRLKEEGYAVQDDGAWIVPVAENDDKKEMPPLILYKRDGAVMYGSTDMATIVERVDLYDPSRIIYIVDQRQSLHFEQVFRAVRKSKIVKPDVELTFAGIGTMNGTDGKPFKTRAGGVMRLDDMINMASDKAMERLKEADLAKDVSEDERAKIAQMIGVAALKFADLQNQRHSDYVFDLERMTTFEGKTGPYLLYQAVRIKSLLRKAGDFDQSGNLILDDVSRPLALLLLQFPDAYKLTVKNYAPHTLCDYIYSVAQAFSSFYGNCHILSEEDINIRSSRLTLCMLTLAMMERVLDLLGIDVPDRM